jgi:succinoglycan biosynthesis transport protein ExoP
MQEQQTAEEVISISEYASMLLKHKLLIVLCLFVGIFAALYFLFTIQPEYQATAKLAVKPAAPANAKSASLTDETGAVDSLFFREFNLNTHLELILSRPVLEKLIDKLQLEQIKVPEKDGWLHQMIGQLKDNFRLLLTGAERVLTPDEKKYLLAESLRKKIVIKNPKLTDLLSVTVLDVDPEHACNIANTVAELYIQYDIANNQLASSNSFTFLKEQAAEFKIKLDQAEAAFLAYKQKENMFSLETMQGGIEEKKKAYDIQLFDARSKQQQIALRLQELESLAGQKNYAARLRSLLGNSVIENLNSQLIAAEIEQSKLSKIYKSKHAEMQAINSTINNLRSEMNRQVEKEIASMRKEKEMLQSSIDKILSSTEELKKEAIGLSGKEKQYLILQDNVKTYKKYYETLISKAEDMSVSSEIRNTVSNINLVERAQKPIYPVKPNKPLLFLAGVFGGLFSGIGLALLLEFSDRTIRTEEDVQSCCDLAVLGVIPVAGRQSGGIQRSKYMPSEEGRRA